MDFTFFQPRARIVKRAEADWEAEKNADGAVTVAVPEDDHLPAAQVRVLAFQPRDMIALSQLELMPQAANAVASFRLQVGETPAEYVHLYAGLERIISKVGDVPMITANLLEAERPYLLGVTSAIAGEGKTTTAMHLAMTIARCTPKRVCLIDLSLSDSDLAQRLGLPANGQGLVSAIEDNIDTVPCIQVTGCDNLMVVPAGRVPANPAKFVRLARIAQFLVATRHAFDVVIIDMPAVTTENAVPLARHMDGVVMVVRAGVTPRDVVTEALETVGPDRVNCVVLNRIKPSVPKWLQKRFARV